MGRQRKVFWELKREYDSNKNPEKERIIDSALTQLKALPKENGDLQ